MRFDVDFEQDSGRKIGAFILITLGIFFLLAQVFNFDFLGVLWPLFVILPGAAFLFAAWRGERGAAPLAVPGMVVTGTGVILFVQNITGHWESWAYAWALYPVFVGSALMFIGDRTHSKASYQTGRLMVRGGLVAFVAFAVFFELFIFGGLFGSLSPFILPALLILIGGYMLLQGRGSGSGDTVFIKPKRSDAPSPAINPELKRKIDEALTEDEDAV